MTMSFKICWGYPLQVLQTESLYCRFAKVMICHTISLSFGVAVAQRLEFMSKEPTANSCVKCSLSGLGCSRVLRGAIDDLAVRIQLVAVRERCWQIIFSHKKCVRPSRLTHYQVFLNFWNQDGGSNVSKLRRIRNRAKKISCTWRLLDCSLMKMIFDLDVLPHMQ